MTMPEQFYGAAGDVLSSPATSGQSADYSGSDHEFSQPTRGLYVTAAGSGTNLLVVTMLDGMDLTLPVGGSTVLPLRVTHVKQSTTVGTVTGLW